MAPDLNAVSGGEKWDYSNPGSGGYSVPDITMADPSIRPLRVLTIGAGVSGIMMSYQIQKYCQNVEHVIYEKNKEIGGTWLENRYPGAACDIPSHAYTMNFALNPDWPRFFSHSPDIWEYLNQVCDCFNLRKYMTFNTEVVGCWWEEKDGQWRVKLRQTQDGSPEKVFEEKCDLLLHGTGILNNFKWPDIPGISDFKGKVVHTARWPEDYQSEAWKNDRVAIVGSGASSIQTVPTMQPHVKHMDIFVRTGVWFITLAGHSGANVEYTQEQRDEFRKDPSKLAAEAKRIEDQVNGLWGGFYSDTPVQKQMQDIFRARMGEWIKDERLLKGFTPKFGVGCRRVTPGDPYMEAIQKPNVDVHFTPVTKITEKGVVGADGTEVEVDTIVCATGFDVSYRPRFPLVGADGIDLAEKWKKCPESYLGLGAAGLPNFLTFIGPTWPVENGSVMGPLLSVSEYAIQVIRKMQTENLHSWTPKQSATDAFNAHAQEWIKHTVWKEDCRAWYRDNDTGRVNAVWPGSSLHYQHAIARPRWEDMHISYRPADTLVPGKGTGAKGGAEGAVAGYGANMWAFLGMGWSMEHKCNGPLMAESAALAERATRLEEEGERGEADHKILQAERKVVEARMEDVSPYLDAGFVDWRWLVKKEGMSAEEAKELVVKMAGAKAERRMRAEIERVEKGEGGMAFATSGFDMGTL